MKKIHLRSTVFRIAAKIVLLENEYACYAIEYTLDSVLPEETTWDDAESITQAHLKFFSQHFRPKHQRFGNAWWPEWLPNDEFNAEPRVLALLLCAAMLEDAE